MSITCSFLSILPDDNGDIFAVSLLVSNCIFSSLILSSIVLMFYILSKKLFLKLKVFSDERGVAVTKKEHDFVVQHLWRFVNVLKLNSDEWLYATWGSFRFPPLIKNLDPNLFVSSFVIKWYHNLIHCENHRNFFRYTLF